METYLICLAAALIGGLMLSRLTKLVNLPAVTAYLVAGLLLGPFCLGALKIPGLGFNSLEQVEAMGIVTQTALGFIAFTIGILQAVITTVVVDVILVILHLCFPDMISVPCALTLGAVADAMAPRVRAQGTEIISGKHKCRMTRITSTTTVVMTACKMPMVMAAEPMVRNWFKRNSLPMVKAMKPRAVSVTIPIRSTCSRLWKPRPGMFSRPSAKGPSSRPATR